MIHGNRDTTVDYSAGKQAYRDAKRPKGLITLRGVDHGMNTGGDPIMTTASLAFFRPVPAREEERPQAGREGRAAVGHRDPAQALVT